MTYVPISILDLAFIARNGTAHDALEGSVALARSAEQAGYRRIWYAEHHNMSSIASSATSVLIAHVAANTSTIRLGSGGIMLPNHSPLTIAEQFGTLETLHPGRIDLGLGRAPGSDQDTMRALRRDPKSAETFPEDVLELQGYLSEQTRIAGVNAIPGRGTNVPLYILGSSLFGARLAAAFGLPYAFASQFAPEALHQAIAVYRAEFKPSSQLDDPYVMAGLNVIIAVNDADAEQERVVVTRSRIARMLGVDGEYTDAQADRLVNSPQGQQIASMMRYTAVGGPPKVAEYLDGFARDIAADELIVVHACSTLEGRMRSVELLADVCGLTKRKN
ncbi:MAG: LLM class flavin-dependent oxidoreductase [Acidobacteria bacterium]|nr:LLM class flavin-dependent oxidoreductase [Acidobacteriota bacterium]